MTTSGEAQMGTAIVAVPMQRLHKSVRAWMSSLGTAMLILLCWQAPAWADFGPQPDSVSLSTTSAQAGAHPDVTASFLLNTTEDSGTTIVDENVKDVAVALPAGVVGNPVTVPRCRTQLLQQGECPPATQVGLITIVFNFGGFSFPAQRPIYNLVPSNGTTAKFGAIVFSNSIVMKASVRPRDAGLTISMVDVPEPFDVLGSTITMWGVPADPSHDAERWPVGGEFMPPGASTEAPRTPFLTNPTECSGRPLDADFAFYSWQHAERAVVATVQLPPVTGCEKLHFDPTISVQPDITQADSPSGYTVDLKVPQNDDPDGLATAQLRKAVVRLPAGVTLSPGVADGLQACPDDLLGFGSATEPRCPQAAELGTATLTTPALPDQLTGPIYLRPQVSGDPYRIALVLAGDGVMLKLPGSVAADPATGLLTTTFDDAPQQPFSELRLRFKGGPRAPLTTSPWCETATTTSVLTPWSSPLSGPDATPSDNFGVSWDGTGAACPATLPFAPTVSAGVTNPVAAASSPFVFRLTREDRNQTLGAISDVKLPGGLLASIKGVTLCSDAAVATAAAHSGVAEQANPGCPANSQIGTVQVGAGPGSHPLYLPGKVYLTGAYKGAPYGLAVVVPAVAGPFDLGTVVVRSAIGVDRTTAQLSVDTDPLPTILGGIPLQLRDIVLKIDRAGFMRNPTSCAPTTVGATAVSTTGTRAALSNRFQVGDCRALGFSPRLALKLQGRHETRDGGHPRLTASLAPRAGQANMKSVRVALPLSLALDPNNAEALCEFADGLKDQCPASSIVGSATATTPLLNKPLSGPVYFVKGVRVDSKGVAHKTLPTLLVTLRGEIALDLRATSTVANSKLVTTFTNIPDAQLSNFHLKINGGKHGILVVTGGKGICKAIQTAMVRSDGQNGKHHDFATRIGTPCGLQVISAMRTSRSVHVKVGGLGKGKLTVTGMGIRRTSRNIRSSTIATVIAPLTAAGRVHKPTRVRVRFDPEGPAKAKTVSARVH